MGGLSEGSAAGGEGGRASPRWARRVHGAWRPGTSRQLRGPPRRGWRGEVRAETGLTQGQALARVSWEPLPNPGQAWLPSGHWGHRLAAGWTSVVRRVENWAGARVPTCSGPSALMQVFPTHRRMSLIQLTPPGDCMVLPAGSGAGEQRESTTAVGRMSLWPRLCRGSPRVAVRAGLRLQWALEG